MRDINFRVEILRNGVSFKELPFATSSPPTVRSDTDAETHMTLSGLFKRIDFDLIKDELRPVAIIDGVEHPLGVYRIATAQDDVSARNSYIHIEAYDRSILLRWHKLEQRDFWPAGTSYDTVISHYLAAAGITRALVVPSGQILQTDREDWDIGTEFLTIINTLLEEINYNSLYFNNSGDAVVTPYVAPSASVIAHRYGPGENIRILDAHTRELDIFDRPNVIVCILSNPEYAEPLIATAVNESPASELSVTRRGMRIPRVVPVDNIADQEALQAYANRLRDEAMRTGESLTISTAINPAHNVGDIVSVVFDDIQGIYKEKSWSISLRAGAEMSHTLERTVFV